MSYPYRPVFRSPEEEESFGELSPALRLRTALAQVQWCAAQIRARLDLDALLSNLRAEVREASGIEAELELTYPSERSPDLQQAARALARVKAAVALVEAAAAFVRVYDEGAK